MQRAVEVQRIRHMDHLVETKLFDITAEAAVAAEIVFRHRPVHIGLQAAGCGPGEFSAGFKIDTGDMRAQLFDVQAPEADAAGKIDIPEFRILDAKPVQSSGLDRDPDRNLQPEQSIVIRFALLTGFDNSDAEFVDRCAVDVEDTGKQARRTPADLDVRG